MFHLRWTSFGPPEARAAPLPIRTRVWQDVCLAVGLLLIGATVLTARPLLGGIADSWWPSLSPRSSVPHPAVVRIVAAEQTGLAQGSGTLVASSDQYGLVLTNWHVIRDATGSITVVFPDGFQSAARVLKVDRDWDLAALMIWRPAAEPIPLASTAPRPGDTLTIAGYGAGPYRAVGGRCTQYVAPGMHMPYEMVEVSAAARQGDSGGPILNARGELAGVLFGSSSGTTSGSYCGRVRVFLASLWPAMAPGDTSLQEVQRVESVTDRVPPAEPPPSDEHSPPAPPPAAPPDEVPETAFAADLTARNATAPLPSRVDFSPPKEPTDWVRLAGETPGEQAKTVLAGIGVLAVLLQLSRWLSSGGDKKKE